MKPYSQLSQVNFRICAGSELPSPLVTFDRRGYDLPKLHSQAPLRPRSEIKTNGPWVISGGRDDVSVEGGPGLLNDVVLNGTPQLAATGGS
jgi:hypothetical protein